ncbi:MAG: dienelactone hydrolase family protein [Alphaproteobacteria bacterium]|nr:dienelactone hydrolase family protein [Alphaproteobacteria bacterium]
MAGKEITLTAEDGSRFMGYLAVPSSRRGPGLVLVQEIFGVNAAMRETADYFAEEGYVVLVPDLFWRLEPGVQLGHGEADMQKALDLYGRFDVDRGIKDIGAAVEWLRARPEGTGRVAVMGFCLGGQLAYLTAARHTVEAAICFYGVGIEKNLDELRKVKCPVVMHFAGADKFVPVAAVEQIRKACAAREDIEIYVYPGVDHAFYNRHRETYNKPAAWMAHSRTIALLRRAIGPRYDLSALWDKHTEYEFATRDVDATMATMVASPYVNHIPTMTGGVGYEQLHRFYQHHFIPKTPKDTRLVPISRTIGADRVVDEMLFCFTHDIEIDWMLPGVAPTGRYVEIPLVAIINFRGDKLYHEHIYWDQASVLVQIGLIDAANLPVAGPETARKLVDETLPSNTLMTRWAENGPL